MSQIKYKRILLKLSGEALAGEQHRGLDYGVIHPVCEAIRQCRDLGVQIGLVIGGGNFWRGVKDGADKMQRAHGDAMGMLATVMNSIAMADALEQHGVPARVLSAVEMNKFAEYFTRDTADRYLKEGEVVIFRRNGQPLFFHRYRRRTPGRGNRSRCHSHGEECGWHLLCRPQHRSHRRQV